MLDSFNNEKAQKANRFKDGQHGRFLVFWKCLFCHRESLDCPRGGVQGALLKRQEYGCVLASFVANKIHWFPNEIQLISCEDIGCQYVI